MASDFIQKISDYQASSKNVKRTTKTFASSASAKDVMNKLKADSSPLNVGNVTIKRVGSQNDEKYDPLQVNIKCEPIDVSCIKEEPPLDFPFEESSNDTYSSFADEMDDKNSDQDYVAYERSDAGDKRKQTIESLNFTCAKCKNSYSDFQKLTNHITSRVSNYMFMPTTCKLIILFYRSAMNYPLSVQHAPKEWIQGKSFILT